MPNPFKRNSQMGNLAKAAQDFWRENHTCPYAGCGQTFVKLEDLNAHKGNCQHKPEGS